jgi:hypothetical protein
MVAVIVAAGAIADEISKTKSRASCAAFQNSEAASDQRWVTITGVPTETRE